MILTKDNEEALEVAMGSKYMQKVRASENKRKMQVTIRSKDTSKNLRTAFAITL